MKLKKLFKELDIEQVKGQKEVEITGICANSKLVAPGNLFVAKKGLTSHGAKYIPEAISAGAVVVLTDIFDPSLKGVTQVIHRDVHSIEGKIASRFYEEASKELFTVGITGTNGKTTASYLIRHLLENLSNEIERNGDQPKAQVEKVRGDCGLIGTIEYIIKNQCYQATRTTPDVFSNHRMLRDMWKQGCRSAVMEVTSHALDQRRVDEIGFDVGIFTNLTLDHLDYHKTMEQYCQAKNRLFRSHIKKRGHVLANVDSPWMKQVLEGCQSNVFTYGIEQKADIYATRIHLTPEGTQFDLSFKGETVSCSTSLIGRYNVYNYLCAIGVALTLNLSLKEAAKKMECSPPVLGRLEPIPNALGLKIYVDFAHSDDALKNVFEALKELKQGRLITVFGCGGDRDFTKRPKMAEVCEQYSDLSIVTSDNPRSENPEEIGRQIVKGFKSYDSYLVELDRRLAIQKAIEIATKDDLVLIAGKGHEKHQIFAHKTVEFDDCKVVEELCEELRMSHVV